jgi:aspartate/methionine/tyrosine aminotransferase
MNISQRITQTAYPTVHQFKEAKRTYLKSHKTIYDFGQALVDFSPPNEIHLALPQFSSHQSELNHLNHVQGDPLYLQNVAKYRQSSCIQEITEVNVLATAGANNAFYQVITALTDPGDEVILFTPYFFNHHMSLNLVGVKVCLCPRKPEQNFQPDLKKLKQKINKRTRAIVIVNPDNPTGMIIKPEIIKKISNLGIPLIIDESYLGFTYGQNQTLQIDLENTILIGSFSKSLSLAGWRIGYVIAQEKIIKQLIKTQDATIIHPSIIAQKLASSGIKAIPKHLKQILPKLNKRRLLLTEIIKQSKYFESAHGEGGVFVFAKLNKTIRSDLTFAKRLLEERGVVVSPGSAWGAPGYLRFSYGLTNSKQIVAFQASFRDWE